MDLIDILRIAMRKRRLVAATVIGIVVFVVAFIPGPESEYTATGSFTLTASPDGFESLPVIVGELAEDRDVRARVLGDLETAADYAVIGSADGLVTVRGRSEDAETAVLVTESVLRELESIAADESVRPREDVEVVFRPVKRPDDAVPVAELEGGGALLEAEGSGILTIQGDAAALTEAQTLAQIGDILRTKRIVDQIAFATDAAVEVNANDRSAVGGITSVADSPEKALAGFDEAISVAEDALGDLSSRSVVAQRTELQVLREPIVSEQPSSTALFLLGVVALAGLAAIALAVVVDANSEPLRAAAARRRSALTAAAAAVRRDPGEGDGDGPDGGDRDEGHPREGGDGGEGTAPGDEGHRAGAATAGSAVRVNGEERDANDAVAATSLADEPDEPDEPGSEQVGDADDGEILDRAVSYLTASSPDGDGGPPSQDQVEEPDAGEEPASADTAAEGDHGSANGDGRRPAGTGAATSGGAAGGSGEAPANQGTESS